MALRFGRFELDEERFELRRDGQTVALQPRALDTLIHLVRHRGRLVTKDELFAGPWEGTTVTDAALSQAIKQLRLALGDSAWTPHVIRTVRGKGFRFLPEVVEVESSARPATDEARDSQIADGRPAQPAPAAVSGSLAAITRTAPVFASRDRELEVLGRAYEEAAAGRGGTLLVHGMPGVGKTRLIEHFADARRREGVQVHFGRCFEAVTPPAYWPWPEVMLSWAAGHSDAELRRIIGDRSSELAALLPESFANAPAMGEDGQVSAFRAMDAVSRFFLRAAAADPMILILEDLHVADAASLQILDVLCRRMSDSRLLVVATCRTLEAREAPLLRSAMEGTLPNVRCLEVSGLGPQDVGDWIERATGFPAASRGARYLHRLTDGHPLLIENLLRALPKGSGPEQLEALRLGEVRLPERVSLAIRNRLGRLPESTRLLLQIASVFGEEFPISALSEVAGVQRAEVVSAVDTSLADGFVMPGGAGRFRFAHALVRGVLYNDLPIKRRLELHLAAGMALKARLEIRPESVGEVAHHLLLAAPHGDLDEALRMATRAAEWARRQHAYGRAVDFYRGALEALELGPSSPLPYCELLCGLAEALTLAGQAEDARAAFIDLFELCELHDFRELFCRAVLGYQDLRRELTTIDGPYHAKVARAIELAARDESLYARLLAVRVVTSIFTARVDQRIAWMQEALQLSRDPADPKSRLAILECAYTAYIYAASPEEMLELSEEMLRLASASNSLQRLFEASCWQAANLLELGRGQEFQAATLRLRDQVTRLDHPRLSYWSDVYCGARAFLGGALDEAEALARAAVAKGEPTLGVVAAGTFLAQLLTMMFEKQGDARRAASAEGAALGRRILAVAPDYVPVRVGTALFELEQGQESAARGFMRMAHQPGFAPLESGDRNFLCVLGILAVVACRLDDRLAAAGLRDTLAGYAGWHLPASNGAAYFGPVDLKLGDLSLVLGDHSAAATHYERAIAESERSLSVTAKAWAELGLHRALREIGGDASHARSDELFESARAAARKYRMGLLSEICQGRSLDVARATGSPAGAAG